MNLKKSVLVAIILCLLGTVAWEMNIRKNGFSPTLDDNEALWAVQRNRVEKASKEDVILTGSSRVLFNIQLDEWETESGIRPIQLASVGSSPLPIFHDLVNNTNFAGTILVGVTPGLFFSTTYPKAQPWSWPQKKVDYYKDRTYAQRLNHMVSVPLQKNLAFLSETDGVDGISLKQYLNKIKVGNRTHDPMPPFHEFSTIDLDRNTKMTDRCATDTAFANTIKKVWHFFMTDTTLPPPDPKGTMEFFLKDAKKFQDRGGNLILLRNPSTGMYRSGEAQFLSRETHWDELVKKSNAKGYHFEDYDALAHFDCPEWSHLSGPDAEIFTTELVKIMMKDGSLILPKTN